MHTVKLLYNRLLRTIPKGTSEVSCVQTWLCRLTRYIFSVSRRTLHEYMTWSSCVHTHVHRQKVYSFLRTSAWIGFYSSDASSFDDLCIQADQNLFNKVFHNPDHVLHRLLPPVAHTSHNYCLRPCAHDRSLPERLTHLTDCDFIIRMLFYQVYWFYLMPACFHCLAIAF